MNIGIKLFGLSFLLGGALVAAPISITINFSGGTFDRGLTVSGVDTESSATTASTACSGTGCVSLPNLSPLNGLTFGFRTPSGSTTGIGSTLTGSLIQSANLGGFAITGQTAFSQNASLTENISATSILGQSVTLSGTMTVTWSGNASVQKRNATGVITLSGDVAVTNAAVATPEPASMLILGSALVGLGAFRRKGRTR